MRQGKHTDSSARRPRSSEVAFCFLKLSISVRRAAWAACWAASKSSTNLWLKPPLLLFIKAAFAIPCSTAFSTCNKIDKLWTATSLQEPFPSTLFLSYWVSLLYPSSNYNPKGANNRSRFWSLKGLFRFKKAETDGSWEPIFHAVFAQENFEKRVSTGPTCWILSVIFETLLTNSDPRKSSHDQPKNTWSQNILTGPGYGLWEIRKGIGEENKIEMKKRTSSLEATSSDWSCAFSAANSSDRLASCENLAFQCSNSSLSQALFLSISIHRARSFLVRDTCKWHRSL